MNTKATVTIEKPYFRWLFNGFGYQNSEANFTALMPDDFRDQRVLKSFAELSPTFARVYTGFADQSREQLDRFADYYDLTFRKAGTTLYAVPCAMPLAEGLDPDEYAGKVAANLEYLVRGRNCRKIRYYGLTNELMNGENWGWFDEGAGKEREARRRLFKSFYAALFHAFRRHGLDIGLLASDQSASPDPESAQSVYPLLDWIKANMDDYVGVYGTHWYTGGDIDDLGRWAEYNRCFSRLVQHALSCKAKRYILGEFGFSPAEGRTGVMVDDASHHVRCPERRGETVLCKCEMGLAAMNQGAAACVNWTFVDYPDPFVVEDGDSPECRAAYEAAKCGWRMDVKYNKWGAFRWSTTDRDYSAYEELYAMGWLVKLFRKNATVLACSFSDPMLRGGAVMNPDRTVSVALVNRGPAKEATVDCSSWKARVDGTPSLHQPLRRYVYEAGSPPASPFNDLQPMSGTAEAKDGRLEVELPAKSITFLTTDYEDRVPPPVEGLRVADGRLLWQAADDPAHRYYRVFRDGAQIASTVATSLPVPGAAPEDAARYAVRGVDQWNNEGK